MVNENFFVFLLESLFDVMAQVKFCFLQEAAATCQFVFMTHLLILSLSETRASSVARSSFRFGYSIWIGFHQSV